MAGGFVTNSGSETGGLIGYSRVEADGSTTSVAVSGAGARIGGLSGHVDCGGCDGFNIGNSSASGAVTFLGSVVDVGGVCGLIGRLAGGRVSPSFATGTVTDLKIVGGLVGHAAGRVEDAYALGEVVYPGSWLSGHGNFGGVIGGEDPTCNVVGTPGVERGYSGSTAVPLEPAILPTGAFGSGAFSGGDAGTGVLLYANAYFWQEPENAGVVPGYARGVPEGSVESENPADISGLGSLTSAGPFGGFDFAVGGAWRMATANPNARGGASRPCSRGSVVETPSSARRLEGRVMR